MHLFVTNVCFLSLSLPAASKFLCGATWECKFVQTLRSLTMLEGDKQREIFFLSFGCCHFKQSTEFDCQSSACLMQSHCSPLIWQTGGHSESAVWVSCITEPTECCCDEKLLASDVSESHLPKTLWICIWRLLAVHFKPLWEREHTVSACLPGAQGVPGRINISIKVLLRGLASANAIAWVIIGKDVAVDARA